MNSLPAPYLYNSTNESTIILKKTQAPVIYFSGSKNCRFSDEEKYNHKRLRATKLRFRCALSARRNRLQIYK